MDIQIVSIIKHVIGENIYYWGRDKDNQIYLLNRYPQLNSILNSLPEFKQDHHNIFHTLNLKKDKSINILRKKIIRITSANFSLN
ncbi:MAG: hypothetical protein P9L97_00745 [Candidatus Tenebribacter davisii]|nr:hypothetical protein [Candidatus Tenebribacter davisii]